MDEDMAYELMREKACDEAHDMSCTLKRPLDYLAWKCGEYTELQITTYETEISWRYLKCNGDSLGGTILVRSNADFSKRIARLKKTYDQANNVYINGQHEDEE